MQLVLQQGLIASGIMNTLGTAKLHLRFGCCSLLLLKWRKVVSFKDRLGFRNALSLEDYSSMNATQILIQREIVELFFTCTRSF